MTLRGLLILPQRADYTARLERVVLQQHKLIQQLQAQLTQHVGVPGAGAWGQRPAVSVPRAGIQLSKAAQLAPGAQHGTELNDDSNDVGGGAAATDQQAPHALGTGNTALPEYETEGNAEYRGSWEGFHAAGPGGYQGHAGPGSSEAGSDAPQSSSGLYGTAATLRQHLIDIT